MSKVYEIVTNRIIEELKKGVIPWHKPFFGNQVNYDSQKPYSGVNMMLLPKAGEYMTINKLINTTFK